MFQHALSKGAEMEEKQHSATFLKRAPNLHSCIVLTFVPGTEFATTGFTHHKIEKPDEQNPKIQTMFYPAKPA